MRRLSLFVLPALLLALAGCGSGSSSSPAPAAGRPASATSTSGAGVQVTLKNLAYSPSIVHAKVGQTVTWTNQDTPPHDVTYVGGPKFTSSSRMNPGATFSIKLTQAGAIHYFCTIHPFMKGTIVVVP